MTVREVFEKGTIAFNAHNMDEFAELMADNVEFKALGVSGSGRPACSAFYKSWLVAFPDGHVEVKRVEVFGDVAVEEGTFTGTHNGVLITSLGDIPATGKSVAIDYIQVIRFSEAKHASFNLSFDRLVLLEQLGLASAAPV
jgi:predicted ester cyclase